ncbi:MAG: hypothetical protein ACYS22_13870, partial [Planctomycetota bacterium]
MQRQSGQAASLGVAGLIALVALGGVLWLAFGTSAPAPEPETASVAGTPESAGPAALSPSKAPLSQDLEAPSSVQALSGSASQGAPLPWEDAAHKDKQAASAELAGLVGRLRAASGDQDYEAVDGV